MKKVFLLLLLVLLNVQHAKQEKPQNIHISLHPQEKLKNNGMIISWWTNTNPSTYQPFCLLGPTPRNNTHIIKISKTRTYNSAVGYTHDVLVDGKIFSNFFSGGLVYYQCGDFYSGEISKQYFFKLLNNDAKKVKVLIHADLGVANARKTIQLMTEKTEAGIFSATFNVGDIGYADVYLGQFEQVWKRFLTSIEPISRTIPYMVTEGNHELQCIYPGLIDDKKPAHACMTYANSFRVYNSRFRMPLHDGTNNGHNMWWSVNHGNIHFISVSTDTDFPNSPFDVKFGDQLKWLKDDLEKMNRQREKYPWIVLLAHRPLYSSHYQYVKNGTAIGTSRPLLDAMEELINQGNVDLVFQGHVHAYERTWPMYKSRSTQKHYRNPKNPTYIIIGNGGNQFKLESDEAYREKPEWNQKINNRYYGYGSLESNHHKQLIWKYFRTTDDALQDQVIIEK